jgi:hypothetical protein
MPFQFTTTLPSDQITVLFKGLIVLSALADGTCEAGVDRITDDHFLIVEIRARNAAANTDSLVMRHAGPLTRDFTLRIDPPLGPSPNPAVFAFQTDNGRFNRSRNPTNPAEAQDFRWKIDLHDQDLFHPPNTLQTFPAALTPRVTISNGTFYTFRVTDSIPAESVSPVAGTGPKPIHRLAAVIGARIPLDDQHLLRVEGDDVPTPLLLPRPGDQPGTKYEISILNEPPAIGTPPDPDELDRYYQALRRQTAGTIVPPAQRFKIRPNIAVKTDEIPCMPIVLGP